MHGKGIPVDRALLVDVYGLYDAVITERVSTCTGRARLDEGRPEK